MGLDELLKTVWESSFGDWAVIKNGPIFLPEWEGKHHGAIAVYKPNISIILAWGMKTEPSYSAVWLDKREDVFKPPAVRCFLDFFFNGMLVYREEYLEVNEYKCSLPEPRVKSGIPDEEVAGGKPEALYFPAHLDRFWQEVFIPLQGAPPPYGEFGSYEWYRRQTGIAVEAEGR